MSDLELLRLTQELSKRQKANVADKFKPWPKQLEFLNTTADITAFIAGNRCLGGETEIYDPVANESKRVDQIESDFHITAWDGKKRVITKATKPFKKGSQPLFEILFSDGTKIVASGSHLLLGESGWVPVSSLVAELPQESFVSHLPSTLDSGQLALLEDVEHSIHTTLGSRCHCSACSCLDDELPLCLEVADQATAPSRADAQEHRLETSCHTPSQGGVQAYKEERSRPYREPVLRSSQDGQSLISVLVDSPLFPPYTRVQIPSLGLYPIEVLSGYSQDHPQHTLESQPQQPLAPGTSSGGHSERVQCESYGTGNEHQERELECQDQDSPRVLTSEDQGVGGEVGQCLPDISPREIRCALSALCVSSKLSIVQICFLRKDVVWDFEVEDYGNYFIGEVLNHNCGKSLTASYMMKCHLTGDYPPWWRGMRFTGPITLWACGITWIRLRDTIQIMLLGKLGQLGTGMIPKDRLGESIKKAGIPYAIDQIQVKHITGEWSRLQFFSYEGGRSQLQGSSVDVAWCDEEPPQEIYDEIKMRILDCHGIIVFTFTPLSGCTPLYDDLMSNNAVNKIHMSMDEAGHLDQKSVEMLLDGMDEYQKQARRYGIASVGSGKVFQFMESEFTVDPFEIPNHWPRLGGLDVGLTHPTGAVAIAKDPDSGTYYLYNEYRVANKTPIDHCAHLKHWGVKFALDPSAFNRQIGTMTSVASMYEDEGLELIRADNNVDKSIMEIRKLIGSGRFFIFTSCQLILKEIRTYRTNDAGKIIKTDDDLVDPMRYSIMGIDEHGEVMKRHRIYSSQKPFKPADPKVGY